MSSIDMTGKDEVIHSKTVELSTDCKSSYVAIEMIQDTEITLPEQVFSNSSGEFKLVATNPVFVQKDESGKEILRYNAKYMELDKPYEVKWDGEYLVLFKRQDHIDIYKFYPDQEPAKKEEK